MWAAARAARAASVVLTSAVLTAEVHEAISRHIIESSSGLKLLNRGSAATVRQLQTGREIDKVARNVGRNLVRQAPEVVRTGRDHGGGAERW